MKKKILIVDDNEDLIKIVQMSFKDSYETLSAKKRRGSCGSGSYGSTGPYYNGPYDV